MAEEKRVPRCARDDDLSNAELMRALENAFAGCDHETVQHCLRVGTSASLVMEEYMRRYNPDVDYSPAVLGWAGTLHDVGKSRVPLRIIMKPEKLTEEERTIIMKHTAFGAQILENLFGGRNRVMRQCAHDVALYHHERFDGRGYPYHLAGEEIPLSAQLVGLADCFDALLSARTYKAALEPGVAFDMIMRGECGNFSKEVLSCLPVLLTK